MNVWCFYLFLVWAIFLKNVTEQRGHMNVTCGYLKLRPSPKLKMRKKCFEFLKISKNTQLKENCKTSNKRGNTR